jgi:long-chain acyl-CoA synthetase
VKITISDGVRKHARRTPDKVALRAGTQALTFGELDGRIKRVGSAVAHGLGLAPGDRVAVLAPNCLEFVELLLGPPLAGVLVASISPSALPVEVARICGDCDPRVLFVHPSLEKTALDAGLDARIVLLDAGYEELLARARPEAPQLERDPGDACWLQYTSGTTGSAKGAIIGQSGRALQYLVNTLEYNCFGPDDHHLAVTQLAHGIGAGKSLGTLAAGGTVTIAPIFHPERVVRMIGERGITNTILVPSHLRAILDLGAETIRRYDTSSLRALVVGGAALSQASKENVIEIFGDGILYEDYGSTEVPVISTQDPEDQLRKHQSVGKGYLGNRIRLLDDAGEPTPEGEIGELHVDSPYTFLGYWNRPEETAAAFRGDYYRTGDLARIDEDGFIYLLDRIHDTIMSGGFTVHAREIEEVLAAHPRVSEVAVFGVPDDALGEVPRAVVVLTPGADIEDGELAAHCAGELSMQKRPRVIELAESLPRGPTGKILRRQLREPFWAGRDRAI